MIKKIFWEIYWRTIGPYGAVTNYFVFPIMGWMRKHRLFGLDKPYDQIEKFKNKHKGERCFVIATGPSLTESDLKLVANEKTFAVNTIFTVYDKIEWRPTYYVLDDPEYQKRLKKEHQLNFDDFAVENCFLCSLNRKISIGKKNIFLNINFLDHVYNFGKSKRFKYTGDLLFGFYDNYSVTQDAIILAIYMGFKEIYLLGADNDYLGNKQHFGGITVAEDSTYKRAVKIQNANDMAYEFVKKVAELYQVKIYNVTRGGKVKCFERKKLEDVIEG